MRIALAFPTLPPVVDGIGDHTARLAAALSAHAEVRVLTAQADAVPIPGAEVARVFGGPGDLGGLVEGVLEDCPDWLVVAYNPFSWGRRGWAPGLVWSVAEVRRRAPGLGVALLMHEPFTPLHTPKEAVMSTWQRAQLWALGRSSDVVFTSIQRWAERFGPWFPQARVAHLPMGSNIPVAGISRAEARAGLGLANETVLGMFGQASLDALPEARAAAEAVPGATVLYVGTRGPEVLAALAGVRHRDLGPLPAADVSRAFSAMDLLLAPYSDGASTRRGTLMTGLAHGVPVVSTDGFLTDDILRAAAPEALRLAPSGDPTRFARAAVAVAAAPGGVGERGRALYHAHFDWPVVAKRVVGMFSEPPLSAR